MTEWEQPLSGGKVDVTTINMNIVTIDGFTGHADRNELLAYVNSCYPKPKKIVINHGESSRCLDLASSLHKLQRVETNAPKNLEAVRIR
jgi:predicted metal-dependent RNase